jgi:hypothetical protein
MHFFYEEWIKGNVHTQIYAYLDLKLGYYLFKAYPKSQEGNLAQRINAIEYKREKGTGLVSGFCVRLVPLVQLCKYILQMQLGRQLK